MIRCSAIMEQRIMHACGPEQVRILYGLDSRRGPQRPPEWPIFAVFAALCTKDAYKLIRMGAPFQISSH